MVKASPARATGKPAPDRLGIGLIGTGYMGKCHALAWNAVGPTFGDVPRIELVALAEANPELAQARAAAFGFARATADWRTLLTDPAVDIISVTTPNALHAGMVIAALEAGKHVWCEKPMATSLADAERMLAVAGSSGCVAALGYNYIQNPMIRQLGALLDAGAIGAVNHVRFEMDEDFMADPETPFSWRSEASAGHGALDDFAVHPLSLITVLFGKVTEVMTDQAKPYATRPVPGGSPRAVATHDIATSLIRLANGASGLLAVNRSAWGRKSRIALQVFGANGSILFDQERFNELQLYSRDGAPETHGYRTVLAAPHHAPYDRFIPAPGHCLGFNDLKVIEAHELISAIQGKPARLIDFAAGFQIERTVDAMARSSRDRAWVRV